MDTKKFFLILMTPTDQTFSSYYQFVADVLKFSGDLRSSSLLGVIRINTRPLY